MITKQKVQLTVAALAGVFLSLTFILLISGNIGSLTAFISSARPRSGDVALSVTNLTRNQIKSGNTQPVVISLSPLTSQVISALSIRLTFSYLGQPRPSVPLPVINPLLISNNWTFPINTVSYDDINQLVTVDISGFNLTTTGYSL